MRILKRQPYLIPAACIMVALLALGILAHAGDLPSTTWYSSYPPATALPDNARVLMFDPARQGEATGGNVYASGALIKKSAGAGRKLWIDPRDYGALWDGVHDDSAALAAAQTDARTQKIPMLIPPGAGKGHIVITAGNITIASAGGMVESSLDATGYDYGVSSSNSAAIVGVVIKGFNVYHANIDGVHLYLVQERSSHVTEIRSNYNGRHGFWYSNCHGMLENDNEARNNADTGFYSDYCQAFTFDHDWAVANNDGFFAQTGGLTSVTNSWSESNNRYQINVGNIDGINLWNNWLETHDNNSLSAIYVNSNRTSFMSGSIRGNFIGATFQTDSSDGITIAQGGGIVIGENRIQGAHRASVYLGPQSAFCEVLSSPVGSGSPDSIIDLGIDNIVRRATSAAQPSYNFRAYNYLASKSFIQPIIPDPNTPTIANMGTAGTTTHTYYLAGYAARPQVLTTSRSSAVTATSTNTLTSSNFNRISFYGQWGMQSYAVFRDDPTQMIGIVQTNGGVTQFFFDDTGQTPTTVANVDNYGGYATLDMGSGAMSTVISRKGSLSLSGVSIGSIYSGYGGFGFASPLSSTNYSLGGNGTDTLINRPSGYSILFKENNGGTSQVIINPSSNAATMQINNNSGVVQIGSIAAGYGGIGFMSTMSSTGYALSGSNADTYLNAPSGAIHLRVNNTTIGQVTSSGLGIGTSSPTSKLQVVGLPTYADNTSAVAGGLTAGAFYRTSTGVLMVVY